MTHEEIFPLFQRIFGGRCGACTVHMRTPSGLEGYRRLCSATEKPCLDGLFPDCGKCRRSRPLPLTAELLTAHLEGRMAIGIYPADEKGQCRFSVIEPKNCDLRPVLQIMAAIAEAAGLTCLRELTDFGKAGRLWIFYGEPTPARTAAEIAAQIMSEAGTAVGGLPDCITGRILPLPAPDFGKPIMLPLFDWNSGFSAFTDSELRPVDGLAALSALAPGPAGNPELPTALPRRLQAELSNMLYVGVKGLSANEINALCRLARVSNPELTSESGPENPPYLWCLSHSNGRLHLPRGIASRLGGLTELELTDSRPERGKLDLSPAGTTEPRLRQAARKLVKRDCAVITGPVGSGKTRLMAEVMDLMRCRTLILTTEKGAALRWHSRISARFDLTNEKISLVTDDADHPNGCLDVALLESRTELRLAEQLPRYGLLILADVDRLHCGAQVFRSVMEAACPRRIYGVATRSLSAARWGALVELYCGGELMI